MSELVTICMPTYNPKESFFYEAMDCALNQTYENIEVLIIDDNSTVDVFKLLSLFNDPRIKYLRNSTNLGMVKNWNTGIQSASGKWLKFHFQDDLMELDCIEKLLKIALDSNTKLSIANRLYLAEEGQEQHLKIHDKNKNLGDYFGSSVINPSQIIEILKKYSLAYNFFGEPMVGLVRSDIFSEYGLFDESIKQIVDFEFWLRVCLNEKFSFIDEPLNKFRIHSKSQSNQNKVSRKVGPTLTDRVFVTDKMLNHKSYKSFKNSFKDDELNNYLIRFYKQIIVRSGFFRFRRTFTDKKAYLNHLNNNELFWALFKDVETIFGKVF